MLKSQVSIEYMVVMGFATLMIIPLLLIYYTYSSESSDAVASSQALQAARKIVDSAESVYYLGEPSQTTLKLNFPDKIESINLSNKEIVFKMRTKAGITDIVQLSSVNMSGNLSAKHGLYTITVKAQDGYVQVTSK